MGALLSLATGLLFLALLASAATRALRRRDPLARDVALLFTPLAVLFLVSMAQVLTGSTPVLLEVLAVVLLFAQPLFALRLVADLRDLPRALLRLAAAALGGAILILFLAGTTHRVLGAIVVVVAFVSLEALAAVYLALEAAHSRGGYRARMGVAAFATAAFALAILIAGAGSIVSGGGSGQGSTTTSLASGLAEGLALLAALGFVAAFLPPAWLRRTWQASAALAFMEQLSGASATESEEALWGRLAGAARALGATAAAVLVASPEGTRIAAASGAGLEPGLAYPRDPTSAADGPTQVDAIRADLLARSATRFATTLPIAAGSGRRASLVLLTAHARLFGADDAELLAVLASQVAALVERRAVLAEQEELAVRLAETVEALRGASEAKSDFLASMSHELRTPLNAIIGFTELMRDGPPAQGGALSVPREWVEHVYTSGQHLLELINDVLDLSKVEAGRLELVREAIDVPAAIAESIGGLRPLAERKDLRLAADAAPGLVHADRGRLRQVLYNLVSNAIKYTPSGGTIEVRAHIADGCLEIAVADTGVGIAPADQAAVFEEFRQVGDPALRQAGTGLGLALTRRLVEAHGGRIELVSAPGVGSTFTVVLPDAVPGGGPPVAHEPAAPDARVRRPVGSGVLVIEDDPGAVRLLRTYLEGDGYRVRVASDGEAGLAEAHRQAPAAILLDVLLPGMDGWDVLRALKADAALREVPVIIVTVVDEREVGLALGAADYFLKPVDRDTLLARLARYTFTTKVRRGPVSVLAVDDDPASLALVEAALVPEGFTVTSVPSGRAALELAAREHFDLVICDLVMPELSGFDVVAGLRAEARTRDTVILILTGHALSEAEKARLNGHVAGIVDKGSMASDGLRAWLARALPSGPSGATLQ